jgi:serine/threonine-protein kinase RsbT
VYPLASEEHLLVLLAAVGSLARQLAFDPKARVELDIALREVGSNAVRHGGGGRAIVRTIGGPGASTPAIAGIEVLVSDEGPGIPDVEAALVDGFSTGGGLGLGLGAAKRLSDSFAIETAAGSGTRIALVKWATRPR